MTETFEQPLTAYSAWLERQLLAAKTCRAYQSQAHQYGEYLAQPTPTVDDPMQTPFIHDYAIQDYKIHLKTERQAKPTSVNWRSASFFSSP